MNVCEKCELKDELIKVLEQKFELEKERAELYKAAMEVAVSALPLS